MRSTAKFRSAVVAMALVTICTTASAQQAAKPVATSTSTYAAGVEPEARAALDRMGVALRKLTGFTLHSDITSEMVLDDGQKIQTGGTIDFTVLRPSGMKIVMASDRQNREIYYNGKTLTIYSPRMGYYGTVDAPETIGLMLDRVDQKYGVEIPMADFFKFGVDQTMTARIKSGFVVGSETIGGQMCEHYAFRQDKVDWQLWIRKDESALPCKLIITSTSDASMPQYTAVTTWNTQATPNASAFTFNPPADAKKIVVAEVKGTGQ